MNVPLGSTSSVWGYAHASAVAHDGRKKVSDSLDPELQSSRPLWGTPCEYWKLNLEPLEEQDTFLTTEPSRQTHNFFFLSFFLWMDFISRIPDDFT